MAKFFPITMYKVLSVMEPGKSYNVKQLIELLPELKYKALEYNLRHYHSHHYLKREKEKTITWSIDNTPDIHTPKYYLYSITNKGLKKLEYLKKKKSRRKNIK